MSPPILKRRQPARRVAQQLAQLSHEYMERRKDTEATHTLEAALGPITEGKYRVTGRYSGRKVHFAGATIL